MKITHSTANMMTIDGAPALDQIRVVAEDIEPRRGRITITCYTKSWNAYWGGMGERTIAQFFCSCDEYYLAKNLSDIQSELIDADSIKDGCRRQVITERRNRDLDKDVARELYDEIDDAVVGDDGWSNPRLMEKIFGDEWWYRLPTKPNPEYVYLCRVIKAVQAAFREVCQ